MFRRHRAPDRVTTDRRACCRSGAGKRTLVASGGRLLCVLRFGCGETDIGGEGNASYWLMYQPPLGERTWPVTNLASSEAR